MSEPNYYSLNESVGKKLVGCVQNSHYESIMLKWDDGSFTEVAAEGAECEYCAGSPYLANGYITVRDWVECHEKLIEIGLESATLMAFVRKRNESKEMEEREQLERRRKQYEELKREFENE